MTSCVQTQSIVCKVFVILSLCTICQVKASCSDGTPTSYPCESYVSLAKKCKVDGEYLPGTEGNCCELGKVSNGPDGTGTSMRRRTWGADAMDNCQLSCGYCQADQAPTAHTCATDTSGAACATCQSPLTADDQCASCNTGFVLDGTTCRASAITPQASATSDGNQTVTTTTTTTGPCSDGTPANSCEQYVSLDKKCDEGSCCETGKQGSVRRRDWAADAKENCRLSCGYCQGPATSTTTTNTTTTTTTTCALAIFTGAFSIKMTAAHAQDLVSDVRVAKATFQTALASSLSLHVEAVTITAISVSGQRVARRLSIAKSVARQLADSFNVTTTTTTVTFGNTITSIEVQYELKIPMDTNQWQTVEARAADSQFGSLLQSNIQKEAATHGKTVTITETPTGTLQRATTTTTTTTTVGNTVITGSIMITGTGLNNTLIETATSSALAALFSVGSNFITTIATETSLNNSQQQTWGIAFVMSLSPEQADKVLCVFKSQSAMVCGSVGSAHSSLFTIGIIATVFKEHLLKAGATEAMVAAVQVTGVTAAIGPAGPTTTAAWNTSTTALNSSVIETSGAQPIAACIAAIVAMFLLLRL